MPLMKRVIVPKIGMVFIAYFSSRNTMFTNSQLALSSHTTIPVYTQTFTLMGPAVGTTVSGTVDGSRTQGGAIGDCLTDSFSVTNPGGSGSPIICGENSGKHSKQVA